jgi:hypothetical protein
MLAQFGQRRCRAAGGDDDCCYYPLAQSVVGDAEHCGLGHRGVGRQRRLHQLRQHRQSAGADRVVDPAQHPQRARIVDDANVIGAEPAWLCERIRLHRIAVTLRQRRAAQHDPAVIDAHPDPVQRHAVVDATTGCLAHPICAHD